jgi:hypothetical protein
MAKHLSWQQLVCIKLAPLITLRNFPENHRLCGQKANLENLES